MSKDALRHKLQKSLRHKYIIHSKIGEGGYGLVYKATQICTGQPVAIKTVKFIDGLDECTRKQQIDRFEREVQMCSEISHPNIVKVLDRGATKANIPFAIFEYLSGETLKDYIIKENGLSVMETVNLMGQVLEALICIHAKGIVHRDLKPNNIEVIRRGSRSYIKILDFGTGIFSNRSHNNYKNSTDVGEYGIGTPLYCAPEQLRGEPSTTKSDLYAWGLIFLECITGEPVMKGNNIADIIKLQLNTDSIQIPNAIVNHPLGVLLRIVLQKNAKDRVCSARQILKEFSEINFRTIVDVINQHQNITSLAEESVTLNLPITY